MSAAPRARILIVDDEPALRRGLARALLNPGRDSASAGLLNPGRDSASAGPSRSFEVLTAEDGPSALGLLATTRVDAVLLDLGLPGLGGAAVLARIRSEHPEVEVVIMAAPDQVEAALAAARAGAFALVWKPLEVEAAAALALERAVERRRLLGRVRALERREGEHADEADLLGASPKVAEIVRKAMGAAASSAPILITGERGVGKELLARAVHRRSQRADQPFVSLSVGALPEALIEEELLGGPEGRGAPGAVAAAGEGTLFLDEVEELPLRAQARLLRALEAGEIRARIIAASAADLRARIGQGRLREDLYYRLGVISLHLPPLRRRPEDIPLLALHFLRRHAAREGREARRIGAEAMRLLREHAWPGNARELDQAMEHAAVMARGEVVTPADLPPTIPGAGARRRGSGAARELAELTYAEARDRAIDAFERAYVAALLERAGGNVSEAARQAGMDRANFRRLRKRVEGSGESSQGGGEDGEEK